MNCLGLSKYRTSLTKRYCVVHNGSVEDSGVLTRVMIILFSAVFDRGGSRVVIAEEIIGRQLQSADVCVHVAE